MVDEYDRGRRDMLNALLALNPNAALSASSPPVGGSGEVVACTKCGGTGGNEHGPCPDCGGGGALQMPPLAAPVPNGVPEGIAVICEAQDVLAEYIVPDSGISDTECVNRLLGILDRQDVVRMVRAAYPPVPRGVEAQPLAWRQGEARSMLGDLYSVHRLSENVWSTQYNGTAFAGWMPTEAGAMKVAQDHYNARILAASPEATP